MILMSGSIVTSVQTTFDLLCKCELESTGSCCSNQSDDEYQVISVLDLDYIQDSQVRSLIRFKFPVYIQNSTQAIIPENWEFCFRIKRLKEPPLDNLQLNREDLQVYRI